MAKKTWTNQAVYDLLCKIDRGYVPDEEERVVLETRKEMNLWNKKLTYVPRSIGKLRSLRRLILSDNQISKLPETIGDLNTLIELNLESTTIQSLPDQIGNLKTVKKLNLNYTPITALPESMGQLTRLQHLNLWRTQISALPESIGQLTSLQTLYLSSTPLTILPESIGQLKSLQTLNLSRTSLTALPESFSLLSNLDTLLLSYTNIRKLPTTVCELPSLRQLVFAGSKMEFLPEEIGQLTSLELLELDGTLISSLPDAITKLSKLSVIDISNTKVSSLPKQLALGSLVIKEKEYDSDSGPGIYAYNTELPSEYFAGKEVLQRFLNEQERRGFREAKVIFLGDGNAGKTYTINRIVNGGEKEPKPGQPYSRGQTHGVRPYDWPCPAGEGEGPFTLHLWDFGGQEMLHAMHRCFLTENTVYALMVSTRASEHTRRIRYWLNSIYAYAKGTKVRVFVNVFGNHGTAKIEKKRLAAEFPELDLRFETLSVRDAENEEFHAKVTEPLIRQARAAEKACGLWPASYTRIKDRIKETFQQEDRKGRQRGWLPSAEYREFCRLEGVDDPTEQEALLRYFTDLGVCFSSLGDRDQPVPENFRLIKPIWLTNALYAIIEECEADQGKVRRSEIEERLSAKQRISKSEDYVRVAPELRYDPEDCKYVLQVAAKYKLVYEDSKDSRRVFFPAACTEERPDSAKKPAAPAFNVVCETDYPYLPETVVQRLMVDCLLDGYQLENCWNGGFLLKTVGCVAMADTVRDDRSLRLDVWSKDREQPVKALLLRLLGHLETEAAGERPQTYVVHKGERFSVRRLRNAEKNDLRLVVGDEGPAIEVRELLGAFPLPRNRVHTAQNDPWLQFQWINSDVTDAFEKLCYEYFQEKYFDESEYPNMPRNFPGVETVVTFSKKQNAMVGFQAKFFEEASASDAAAKIKRSAQKAVEQYKGQKGYLFVYSNKELNEQNESFTEIRQLLEERGIILKCCFGFALYKDIKDNYPRLEHDYFTPLSVD